MASSTLSAALKGCAKLVLTGATITAIGWFVLTFYPGDEGVKPSAADIWDFSMFERSNDQKFATALEQLGHEPPRMYEWNGNEVYFSTRATHKTPEELVYEYQEEFVRQGVNEEAYHMLASADYRRNPENYENLTLEDTVLKKHIAAQLTGQIVPMVVNDKYMTMGGGLIEGEPTTRAQFEDLMQKRSHERLDRQLAGLERVVEQCGGLPGHAVRDTSVHTISLQQRDFLAPTQCGAGDDDVHGQKTLRILALSEAITEHRERFERCDAFIEFMNLDLAEHVTEFPDKVYKGFRSIEAFREQPNGQTIVTATWSQGKFDLDKATAGKANNGKLAPDPTVATCPTCTHIYRFASRQSDEPYVANLFISQTSPSNLHQHYLEELTRKGWERSETNEMLQEVLHHTNKPFRSGDLLSFTRGDKHLNLLIEYDAETRRSTIFTLQGD